MTEPERRLSVARDAAGRAADYLKQALWYDHVVTEKGPYDLALTADTEAGRIISALVHRAYPNDGILEEDGPADDGTAEWLWIIDPLDGTVNYHHRLPWFCVSVACYHRTETSMHPLWRYGQPVASVVTAPLLGQEFHAVSGRGARCGSRPLQVSSESLGRGLLSTSRGSRAEDQTFMRGFMDRIGPNARKTRSHGAAALDLAFVAQGSLVGHAQRFLQPWDVAAGAHLVLEAGGHYDSQADSGGDHVLATGTGAYAVLKEAWTCGS